MAMWLRGVLSCSFSCSISRTCLLPSLSVSTGVVKSAWGLTTVSDVREDACDNARLLREKCRMGEEPMRCWLSMG